MMRVVASALVGMVVFVTPAVAADIRGVIAKVDVDRKEVQIEVLSPRLRGQVLRFSVDDQTTVRVAGEPSKLADLAPGQRVGVDYSMRDGQRVLLTVRVRGLRPIAPPPVEAKPKQEAARKEDPNAVAGVLRHINYTEREIIVVSGTQQKQEKQHSFQVPGKTKISKDGKPFKFDDLKEGQSVVVYSETRDGKRTATAVEVGATAVKPAADQPKAARLERIRRILQMVDSFLEMAQQEKQEGK